MSWRIWHYQQSKESTIKRFMSSLSSGHDAWHEVAQCQPPTQPRTTTPALLPEETTDDEECYTDVHEMDDDDDDEFDEIFDDDEIIIYTSAGSTGADAAPAGPGADFSKTQPPPPITRPSLLSALLKQQCHPHQTHGLQIKPDLPPIPMQRDHFLREEISESLQRNLMWEHIQQKPLVNLTLAGHNNNLLLVAVHFPKLLALGLQTSTCKLDERLAENEMAAKELPYMEITMDNHTVNAMQIEALAS
ncbi:hypothetical protein DFQ29_001631 [Apophysomyces sp. BC1021]|nr:hypothetical protein DFQ29_001631 [Apophysomyces sp. BC1021]